MAVGGSSSSGSNTRPATPASSSRTTRSAVKKRQQLESSVESTLTPTRKQQQKAALLAAKSGGSSSSSALKRGGGSSSSSDVLHPPLPRPPSWQQGIASQFENKSPRRRKQRRTSNDERDPGDSVNSTEDEMELDGDDLADSVFRSPSAIPASATSTRMSIATPVNNKTSSSSGGSSNEKQNICVCVRIRPSAPGAAEQEAPIWELDAAAGRISLSENHPIIEKRKTVSDDAYDFKFDSLLLPPHPTSTMYEGRIQAVVSAAMEGYNGTIFSYGQTGSGKTHTMTGSDEEPGILPLAISDIFNQISTDTERGYLLRVSYLEIYNETLKDLLEPVKQKNQELKVGEDKHGRIVVHNMKEEVVTSPQAVLEVLTRGEDNRSINCTDWNQRSSRSHCVFSMTIESRPRKEAEVPGTDADDWSRTPSPTETQQIGKSSSKIPVRISQLNLIDLAGSERATSQEERRKEGAFINKSLLSLGNVIQKLAEGKNGSSHIPYRDSKLTRLLQTSLSGNARIAIICTISPESRHGIESVSTLKFAQRASKIETKAEQGLIYGPGALIAEYEETIADLQSRLAEALKNNTPGNSSVHLNILEEERRARAKAEQEAKDYGLSIISLKNQIEHLKTQMLTGSSEASETGNAILRTPSMAKRHYGDIGSGSRPGGPPGSHRRLSEMAFGIASPLRGGGLPASSSMRSISTALDAVSSAEDDRRVQQLEAELAAVRAEHEKEQTASRATIERLKEEVEAFTERRTASEADIEQNKELNDQLQRERDALKTSLTDLQDQLSASNAKLDHATQVHRKEMEESNARVNEVHMNLNEKTKRITELEKAEALSGLSASAATKELKTELQQAKTELEQLRSTHTEEKAAIEEQLRLAQNDLVDCQASLEARQAQIAQLQEIAATASEEAKTAQSTSQDVIVKAEARVQSLEKQISDLKRDQALEVAEIDAEYRQKAKRLQQSLQETQSSLEQQKLLVTEKDKALITLRSEITAAQTANLELRERYEAGERTISSLNDVLEKREQAFLALETACAERDEKITTLKNELDQKEQARIRLAQLKAANTPPDFGALQAKMQAVSNRSASKPLSNSLGALEGTRNNASSDQEKALAELKRELQTIQSRLKEADKTIASRDRQVRDLLHAEQDYIKRIAELEDAIAGFRKQIEANRQKLEDLTGGGNLARELEALSIRAASPEHKASQPSKAFLPLGAMSPHRQIVPSNALYRSSGLSTPTKKDAHGYSWNSRPDPLPLPPGTPEWRKQRRQTTEHELERLRTGGLASRNKSILQSPRLERPTMDWGSHERSGSVSNQNSPMRVKKGSAGSNYSAY